MHMKRKKIKYSLLIVFALMISILSDINVKMARAKPASIDLNITRYQQVKSNWCWAAAAQMIGKYLGGSKTQYQISTKVKGNSTNNSTASLNEVVSAIQYAVGNTYDCYYVGVKLYGDLEVLLGDCEIPQGIRMQWDDGGGHVIAVEGYTNDRQLRLVDPGENCSKHKYYYTALVNGTTIKSGKGHYAQTFVVE